MCTDAGLNVGAADAVALGDGDGVALDGGGDPPAGGVCDGVCGSIPDEPEPDEHAAHMPERTMTMIARRTAHPSG
jgi:hypothetical protein